MAVTTSTLYSASRDVIKSLINDNVPDPKTGQTNSRRKWIYREFPDATARSFAGYPIIVLNQTDVGTDIENLNNTFMENTFTFDIEIYVDFTDVHARLDTISDSVVNVLLSDASQTIMQTNNLFSPKILSSAVTSTTVDRNQLTVRIIRLEVRNSLCY